MSDMKGTNTLILLCVECERIYEFDTEWPNSGRQEVGWWSPGTWGVAMGSCLFNDYRISVL